MCVCACMCACVCACMRACVRVVEATEIVAYAGFLHTNV